VNAPLLSRSRCFLLNHAWTGGRDLLSRGMDAESATADDDAIAH